MLAIEDNELSQYYASICEQRWNEFGLFPERFPASTPHNRSGQINFAEKKFNGRPFSEIEKAIWDSHFRMWTHVHKTREEMVILEHDCYPHRPLPTRFVHDLAMFATFPRNERAWKKGAEKVSPGAGYFITPKAADMLIQNALREPVTENVDGHIYTTYRWITQVKRDIEIEAVCQEWFCAFQIVNYELGTTAEHNGKVGE